MERNSSPSGTIKGKAVPVKKQNAAITPSNSKQGPSTSRKPRKPKVGLTGDKQTELILKVFSQSTSSLLSSEDEDKRNYIQNFIEKAPMNSNDLTNPPNTVRVPSPDENANQNSVGSKRNVGKKTSLEVQILPPLDIKRSLITQKLPDVAIGPIDDEVVDDSNKMSSKNVKYVEMMHGHKGNKDLPKEQPSGEAKYNPDKNVSTHSDKKKTCTIYTKNECCCPTNTEIKELYIKPQQLASSINEMPSTSNKNIKGVLKERGTVCEELNLDIDNLPSVRALKEIQNYLEQKCTLIRSRLEEESKLKTGGTLSLRYKLSEPPLWQCSNSKAEPESEKQIPKAITCSPLKTYSSIKSPLSPIKSPLPPIKSPLSPLQKHDKSQQISSTLLCNANPTLLKSPVETDNKSLQVSISESTEMPIARKEDKYCSPQCSIETSNKDIDEMKESFKTPSLTSPKTAKCLENPQLVSLENQRTDINRFPEISTQTNKCINQAVKYVPLEIVTKQCFFIPNESKETQTSQVNVVDEMTNTPIEEEKKINTAVKNTQTIINETSIKETATCCLQSNATQTLDVKDKCTVCNIQSINEKAKKPQITYAAVVKDTKECCTQYSSVLELEFEAPQYKQKNSCWNVDRPKDLEARQYCGNSKMRNRRPMQRHKMCSTPVSPPSSISTAETVSLSDGEVKMSCECSTSIGEIHLCRFANNIRKKVRILKRNPGKLLNESFGLGNLALKRQHKYNDNWFAYYVTKTETSSEHATGSNLSSIKSNIETE